MQKRKGKAVSFDAMVKFFMQNYNIPTKKDVDRLMAKLDRLENLLKATVTSGRYPLRGPAGTRKTAVTAVDVVFDVIKRSHKGLGFADIQAKTVKVAASMWPHEVKRFGLSPDRQFADTVS